MRKINDRRAHMGPIGGGESRAVIAAGMAHSVLEFSRLPVRSVAPALTNKLEVAVEALEAGRPQGRRYLALQRGLRLIPRGALGSGYGQRNLALIIALIIIRFAPARSAARQRNTGKRGHGQRRPSAEPIDWPSGLHSLPLMMNPSLAAFRGLHRPTQNRCTLLGRRKLDERRCDERRCRSTVRTAVLLRRCADPSLCSAH